MEIESSSGALPENLATDKFLEEKFDYDELLYSTLDYRGAAVATKQ